MRAPRERASSFNRPPSHTCAAGPCPAGAGLRPGDNHVRERHARRGRAASDRPSDLTATVPNPSQAPDRLPSWLAEGWANPSDEHLRAAAEYRDKRPIQRARQQLVDPGLVEHREVRRGELLPNGERARFRHWIYVAGPVLRAVKTTGEGSPCARSGAKMAPMRCPKSPESVPFWSPRSVDPEDRSKTVRSSAPPEPPTATPLDVTKNELRLLCGINAKTAGRPHAPSQHRRSRRRCWRARSLATCRRDGAWMEDDPQRRDRVPDAVPRRHERRRPSKVARACHVIDFVVREHSRPRNKPPSLRFIFHREIFWKRLDALTNPDAKPLTKAARRPVDAPTHEKAPEVAKRLQSSPPTDCGPRVDAETMRRDSSRGSSPRWIARRARRR